MASLLATPAGAQSGFTCDGLQATIVGTPGDDVLNGTPGPDVIVGLQGDDTIHGMGGDDTVCAGQGDDMIVGGAGFDVIFAAQGNDLIYAASGESTADRVDTRGARMFGGDGNDTIHGSNRWDRMQGGPGVDNLFGYEGRDWMRAGSGNDSVDGGAGIDDLHGGNGADVIELTPGDSVRGGAGLDQCNLGAGDPDLFRSCGRNEKETATPPPTAVTPILPIAQLDPEPDPAPVAPTPDPAPVAPTPDPAPVQADPEPSAAEVQVVSCDASAELVELTNTGGTAITLTGWTLRDEGPNFTFPLDAVRIGPNETVTLQFGDDGTRPGAIRIADRNVWNNGGDTAFLHDASGALVSERDC